MSPRLHPEAPRLAAAAATLRTAPALGPADLRDAIAGWLEESARITDRIERSTTYAVNTLPCVLDILAVIEASATPSTEGGRPWPYSRSTDSSGSAS